MLLINLFICLVVFFCIGLVFIKGRRKNFLVVLAVLTIAVISSIPAIIALLGDSIDLSVAGTYVTSNIPIRIDALSGFFILTINFTFITGVLYGVHYMHVYKEQTSNLSLHWICYILTLAALITVCSVQNSIVFLIAWEIIALSAFILVIFEHNKQHTLKAGINYLIQSHVAILFLTIAFIWVFVKQNSYDFKAIHQFSLSQPGLAGMALMFFFFIGFAIKAGFVPFHTWLPHAHPAAPSHVSGVMSGVIIKIGIYGIFRMLFLIHIDYKSFGYFILIISIISGVYGVMLAIIQHNLKRLLAYHSIENIGIIGMGIGIGCIGLGNGNQMLVMLGFAGALLHTLNHSLFKSLLFYSAGNIYQSTHTMDIDCLGGAGKNMRHTGLLFLIAALAICGLPPFNGFVSEFLIYNGLFNGLKAASLSYLSLLAFSIFGLALIGGLAILCFTKAFGSVFLGSPRFEKYIPIKEFLSLRHIPLYAIAVVIISIGIFPGFFFDIISKPVQQLNAATGNAAFNMGSGAIRTITHIGYASLGFILLSAIIYFVRYKLGVSKQAEIGPTWGCGYVAPTQKLQYTASSFVRNYRKLAEPVLLIEKHKKDVEGIFPGKAWHETNPKDKTEELLLLAPLRKLRNFLSRINFLQNGRPQVYILYGAAFIMLIITVPAIIDLINTLIKFLKTI
jgi:hydrogenase-4 component B